MLSGKMSGRNCLRRKCKVYVRSGTGTASKGAKQYSISLQTKWMQMMGISPDARDVELSFDGTAISIKKREESELA